MAQCPAGFVKPKEGSEILLRGGEQVLRSTLMKIESLHVGLKVRHPMYGVGQVKTISEHTAEIRFDDSVRVVEPMASELQPAEAQAAVSGLEMPLAQFVDQVVNATVRDLGLEKPDALVDKLAARWHGGKMVLHPADPTLQTKEVPLEVFFHKIVMMRNNFRNLEQKVNNHPQLSDAEKVDLQQYISRCYGSLTTFNLFFKDKADHFGGTAS
jgi:hypothetical protein